MPGPKKRTNSASRVINATPEAIYRAFVDPAALAVWLPPSGMTAQIREFEPREGGAYKIVLTYDEQNQAAQGKTSEHEDIAAGRFVKLVPDKLMVQSVEFDSDDPAFAGTMTMTWTLSPTGDSTEVRIVAEDVPEGITPEDHAAGMNSTLKNLAAFVE